MEEGRSGIAKQVSIICFLGLAFYSGETLAQRSDITPEMKQEFLKEVTQGNEVKVRELLRTNPRLARITDDKGVSALLQAVYNGRNNTANLLLHSGIKLNIFEASATGKTRRVRAASK